LFLLLSQQSTGKCDEEVQEDILVTIRSIFNVGCKLVTRDFARLCNWIFDAIRYRLPVPVNRFNPQGCCTGGRGMLVVSP
jgi:hypothetical protein